MDVQPVQGIPTGSWQVMEVQVPIVPPETPVGIPEGWEPLSVVAVRSDVLSILCRRQVSPQ